MVVSCCGVAFIWLAREVMKSKEYLRGAKDMVEALQTLIDSHEHSTRQKIIHNRSSGTTDRVNKIIATKATSVCRALRNELNDLESGVKVALEKAKE